MEVRQLEKQDPIKDDQMHSGMGETSHFLFFYNTRLKVLLVYFWQQKHQLGLVLGVIWHYNPNDMYYLNFVTRILTYTMRIVIHSNVNSKRENQFAPGTYHKGQWCKGEKLSPWSFQDNLYQTLPSPDIAHPGSSFLISEVPIASVCVHYIINRIEQTTFLKIDH